LEKFVEASKAYDRLASSSGAESEANDLKINRSAVDAQLEWAGLGYHVRYKKPQRDDLEAFESAFNAACGSIARGELAQSEVLLKRARRMYTMPLDFHLQH
jgi:signal recognition particle subunit SRP72